MPKLVHRPDVGTNLELFDRRPIQLEGFTLRSGCDGGWAASPEGL